MNDYEMKQEARRQRLQAAAERARDNSTALHEQSRKAVDGIPFGQPVLVGHHSERHHRAALDKQWAKLGQAVAESKRAGELEAKAAGVGTAGISSDDPDSISKLRTKVAELEKQREMMKRANKVYAAVKRKKLDTSDYGAMLLSDLEPIAERCGFSISSPVFKMAVQFQPQWSGDKPFSYQLQNLGNNLRRYKKRIDALLEQSSLTDEDTTINGVRIEYAATENRVRLYFPGKPHDSIRQELKRHGFRWARSIGAWQRHYSNGAKYHAERIAGLYP